jgi:glucoamylase
MTIPNFAPGWPGIPPRWTSSAKSGVGTAHNPQSSLWFTFSHGILNEIYYHGVDQACTRDMGFIVTDGKDFFSEEKRHASSKVSLIKDGVPFYRLLNTCKQGLYQIEKEILTDPDRPVLLQRIKFKPLKSTTENYRLYILLAPHLGNCGYGNTAWVQDYKGLPMLMAQREGNALGLACSGEWLKCSAGFVGFSDGWLDLSQNKQMTWEYARAENGNVALTAEIDLKNTKGEFVLALGFGTHAAEAANRARASLQGGFDTAKNKYMKQWDDWQGSLLALDKGIKKSSINFYRQSTMVMHAHESSNFPGGIIASLSIPWGFSKGDEDLGGYHLVWSRDLVEIATGLLAAGADEDVRRVINYLQATQEEDGHWPQNMWLDGLPYWHGIQMDETALPILLMDLAWRQKTLTKADIIKFWPMVRQAAIFLLRNGPISPQDRWEEAEGYTPFTIATEIAALLAAADLAEINNDLFMAKYLRETADIWNEFIDHWMYVSDHDWCQKYNVKGYYMRIASLHTDEVKPPPHKVSIKNVSSEHHMQLESHWVSTDALALVRFGLRDAKDPRILDTIKVIDGLLKAQMPTGSLWYRYNRDGYGEHANGSPFDGTGIGRPWPLLSGERAHYEISAGNPQEAGRLIRALESFANEGGLFSEQIWDKPDLPKHGLYLGRPSGSAMPLVWAHAEYVKLLRSLRDGRVFDMPPQTVERYLKNKTEAVYIQWRFNHQICCMPYGKKLRVETLAPFILHWTSDDWKTIQDTKADNTGLSIYVVNLATDRIPQGQEIKFTFYWPEADRWEGSDFIVRIGESKKN